MGLWWRAADGLLFVGAGGWRSLMRRLLVLRGSYSVDVWRCAGRAEGIELAGPAGQVSR